MGSLNYWVPFICGNTEENKILIGYSASPDIHIYSVKERTTESVSIKSIYADTIPLPLTKKEETIFQILILIITLRSIPTTALFVMILGKDYITGLSVLD